MAKKIKYILLGILGIVVITVVILTILVWPSLPEFIRSPGISPEAKVKSSMAQIQAKAELIKTEDKSYNNLSCNYDNIMIRLCEVIEKQVGIRPTIYVTKDKYCAYIELNNKSYYCIDSIGAKGKISVNPSSAGYCNGRTFVCPSE